MSKEINPAGADKFALPPPAREQLVQADPTTTILSLPRVDYTRELDFERLPDPAKAVALTQLEILGRVDGLLENLAERLPNLVGQVRSQAGGFVAAVAQHETERAREEHTQNPRAYAAVGGFIPRLFAIYRAGWLECEDAFRILRAYVDGVEETAQNFSGDVVSLRLKEGEKDQLDLITAVTILENNPSIYRAGRWGRNHFLFASSHDELRLATEELSDRAPKARLTYHKVGVPFGTREMWGSYRRVLRVLDRVTLQSEDVVPVVSGTSGEELGTPDEVLMELEELAISPDNQTIVYRELKQRGGQRRTEIKAREFKKALVKLGVVAAAGIAAAGILYQRRKKKN